MIALKLLETNQNERLMLGKVIERELEYRGRSQLSHIGFLLDEFARELGRYATFAEYAAECFMEGKQITGVIDEVDELKRPGGYGWGYAIRVEKTSLGDDDGLEFQNESGTAKKL
ncbi:hypothetical protein [Rhizobium sp. ZPR3]|uniref:Uncharacterized protein n=2 Tax=unclassified Rhizobium TaxID=2613769 RepID=A0AAU7SRW6_9HYPH